MPANQCPACRYLNAPEVRRCEACGADLGTWDALPLPVLTFTQVDATGALWLDDLPQPEGHRASVPDAAPEEAPMSLSLREVEAAPLLAAAPRGPREPASDAAREGTVDGPPAGVEAAARAQRKAARRAQVRRARLRGSAAGDDAVSPQHEILVLAPDDGSRDQLCGLLRAFGFGVHIGARHSVDTPSRPMVAVFVDMAIDLEGGGDGIDLCHLLHEADRRRGGHAPVLVLVAGRLRPVDQVRATLAGCDDVLQKPVTRGSVASVLDARGITLPSDARRL